jgi:hypothetical protein
MSSVFSRPLKNKFGILVGKDVSDMKASDVSKGVEKANLKALIAQDDADSGENETKSFKKGVFVLF